MAEINADGADDYPIGGWKGYVSPDQARPVTVLGFPQLQPGEDWTGVLRRDVLSRTEWEDAEVRAAYGLDINGRPVE